MDARHRHLAQHRVRRRGHELRRRAARVVKETLGEGSDEPPFSGRESPMDDGSPFPESHPGVGGRAQLARMGCYRDVEASVRQHPEPGCGERRRARRESADPSRAREHGREIVRRIPALSNSSDQPRADCRRDRGAVETGGVKLVRRDKSSVEIWLTSDRHPITFVDARIAGASARAVRVTTTFFAAGEDGSLDQVKEIHPSRTRLPRRMSSPRRFLLDLVKRRATEPAVRGARSGVRGQ